MEIAKVEVGTVRAKALSCKGLPRGIAGGEVVFEFTDPAWEALDKVAVFQGACVRDVTLEEDKARIPQEVVSRVNCPVRVGVYGWDGERGLVIPTLWAELGTVKPSADPSGDPAGDPEFAPWVQLRQDLGELKELETEAKGSLVAAVNELAGRNLDDPPMQEGTGGTTHGISNGAVALLTAILQAGIYTSDQSENILRLAELLGSGGDEPDVPVEPEEQTPAILGVAVLGRTILGDYGSDMPKLAKPVIRLVTVADVAPKLDAPVIRLESDAEPEPDVPKLAAPTIRIEEVFSALVAPVIELVEV